MLIRTVARSWAFVPYAPPDTADIDVCAHYWLPQHDAGCPNRSAVAAEEPRHSLLTMTLIAADEYAQLTKAHRSDDRELAELQYGTRELNQEVSPVRIMSAEAAQRSIVARLTS